MLLYAGITSWSFKYSNLMPILPLYFRLSGYDRLMIIVTKLKQRSQSAGNLLNKSIALFNSTIAVTITNLSNLKSVRNCNVISQLVYVNNAKAEGSSETLRNKTNKFIKKVSIHVPTHLKPTTDTEFGYYLAGLIDGDGHFSKTPQLVIVFNELDASLAYYLKQRLGYGNVYKVKTKKAIILVVSKLQGIAKVINLINGKLRDKNKLDQIKNNILINSYFTNFTDINLSNDTNLNNYWLSGFADADASFQIKILNRVNRAKPEIRLTFQIDQKKDDLLLVIKQFLGGNIGYRKNTDTYYYSSTSFGSANKVIHYFNNYHLLSSKHLNYLNWRKAYLIVQNKEHLTELGLNKIIKLKEKNSDNLVTSIENK
uniref:LAGLIDADG homing endonuclease n=1 Tax=Fuscoporia viticola TaxID=139386 RepID=UPI0023AA2212|nr:LAGLIDADG homing endonuclease [Fuscoporia viticola]WCF76847.1 LAGLIDADG homing endonuclease [Fuscoporia viticola]